MNHIKTFFTILINLCYPDKKKKIATWGEIILFIVVMATVIVLAMG